MSRRRPTVDRHAVDALLTRTRAERGMELVVTNDAAIARVAAIVAGVGGGASDAA